MVEEKKKRGKPPPAYIVALRKAAAEARGEEPSDGEGGEGKYSALRRDRPIETFGAGRKCECCRCVLAESNPDVLCGSCDSAIARWNNFPWDRVEIEKGMAKHCLDYVRAKAERKKARHGVPRDTASGSFTRAVGRREIGRKVKRGKE